MACLLTPHLFKVRRLSIHRQLGLVVVCLLTVAALTGCKLPRWAIRTTPGPLTAETLSVAHADGEEHPSEATDADTPPATISMDLPDAMYALQDEDTFTVLLLDGSPDKPNRAAVLRFFWRPRGGRTPVDPNATNALLTYIDFRQDTPMVLHGAGFVYPRNDLGSERLSLDVWQMDLRLSTAASLNALGADDNAGEGVTDLSGVTLSVDAAEADLLAEGQTAEPLITPDNAHLYRATGRIRPLRDDRRTERQIGFVEKALKAAQQKGFAATADTE